MKNTEKLSQHADENQDNPWLTLMETAEDSSLPEVVDDEEIFLRIPAIENKDYLMMADMKLRQQLATDFTFDRNEYRNAVFYDSNKDTENYREHLRMDIAAAERAHDFDPNELAQMAELLETEQTLEAMARVAQYLYDGLGLKGTLKILDDNAIFRRKKANRLAGHLAGIDSVTGERVDFISINTQILATHGNDGWGHLGVIGHEIWHAYQSVQEYKLVRGEIENPEDKERAKLYLFNHLNYIPPQADYENYRCQLLETEANRFQREIERAEPMGEYGPDWEFDAEDEFYRELAYDDYAEAAELYTKKKATGWPLF